MGRCVYGLVRATRCRVLETPASDRESSGRSEEGSSRQCVRDGAVRAFEENKVSEFHLHLETRRARPEHLKLKESYWSAAAERHPELAKRLRVTIGWDDEILEDALETADFMITQYPPRERLSERAPRLRWIQTTGAGIDQLMPLDWLPPNVTLTNNRGAHGQKAEDSCTLALLSIHMAFPQVIRNQRERRWEMVLTPPIAGRTAVVLGFGDLGQG